VAETSLGAIAKLIAGTKKSNLAGTVAKPGQAKKT